MFLAFFMKNIDVRKKAVKADPERGGADPEKSEEVEDLDIPSPADTPAGTGDSK